MEKKQIIDFFKAQRCGNCQFKTECENMYQRLRAVTTDTFSLCDVIYNDFIDD